MEYEYYEDVIDAYEAGIGVEEGDSLTDYIRKNNIKIKNIEPFRPTESKADGGIMGDSTGIGIEVLFKPKRQNLFMGGPALTGPALSIYNSMKAYDAFTDQEIADAIKQAGYSLPTADSSTPSDPPSSAAPDSSNQSGGGGGEKGLTPTFSQPTKSIFGDKFSTPKEKGTLGDRLLKQSQGILSKIPLPGAMLGQLRSPFNPSSPTYNPNFVDQLNFLEATTGKRITGTGDDLTVTEGLGMIGRDPNTGGLKYGSGSVLSGKNVISGFGTNDYETSLRNYISKMASRAVPGKPLSTFQQAKLDQAQLELNNLLNQTTGKDGTTTAPKTLSEKIIEGITAAEDDKEDEMLKDIETIINKDIDTKVPKKKPTTFPDYSEVTGVTRPGTPSFPDYSGVTGVTKPGAPTGIETIKTGQLTKEQYEQMADLISKTNATVYNETTGKYEDIFGNEIKNPNAIDDATLVGTTKTKTKGPVTGTTKPGTGGRGPVTGTTKPGTKSKGTTTGTTKPGTKSKSKSITDRGRGQSNVGTKSKGPVSTKGQAGPPSQRGGGGGGGCFLKGTLITMLDGTRKPVEQVDLGDKVAVGGKVFAVGRFLNTELYDYKGIKVSGSHMVNEDGTWMRVRDTKHGKSLGNDENTVYVFGSENRRILINDILFTDYFEIEDQEQLLKEEDKFFDNWKTFANNEDIKNVNTLNAS